MKDTLCPSCSKGLLRETVGQFRTSFQSAEGDTREVVVRDVVRYVCDKCDESILEPDSENRISEAQRHALRLLTAEDLRVFRARLGKSQEEISELLGLGKKTWCRWESPDYFQSEALDRYLRLLMFAPSNLEALELISRRKETGEIDLNRVFKFIEDIPQTIETSQKFQALLMQGPFRD